LSGLKENPAVSVVVPTRGRPTALQRCVEALRAQNYPASSLQIVVVDDGGPEPELGRLPNDPEVTVIRQHNQGPAAARNLGAREAGGEILAFTDDDCRPRRDWLTHLVQGLSPEPTTMAGGCTVNGLAGNVWAQASQDLISFLYEAFRSSRSLQPFMTTNNLALQREAFLTIGGFDIGFPLPAAEDRDLSERWAAEVGQLRLVPEAVVDHFHQLNAWSFMRQHHGYGRGAVQLAQRRRARGHGVPAPEPLSFYFRMIAYPYRQNPGLQGLVASGLVAGSQFCGLTGMARESMRLLLRRNRQAADPDGQVTEPPGSSP
jgi:GT2 family glycosyltransferase